MSSISKNLQSVREKIKCAYLKRAVELQTREPRLVAVSKTKPKESVIEAYKYGQLHFGENYVQEIIDKAFDKEVLDTCPEIKWHFIGHLQRNKVNKLVAIPNLYLVETVDSEKLAEALDSAWKKVHGENSHKLNVFIQVNTSGEEAKSGCTPDEACKLVKFAIDNCSNLNVMGVMTIGKYDNYDVQEGINPDFQCLLNCHSNICRDLNIDSNKFEISMGMSGDFEHAVEVGATNVRVGSLIFGSRKPYQVILDGTMCVAALKSKINIHEQFTKYLDGDAKLLITQCIVKEVEKLGPSMSNALFVLKNFAQHQCGHDESPVPASSCILHMVGEKNTSRYIIATQDRELQHKCRQIAGVPLLYLHSKVPTLEGPSIATQKVISNKLSDGFGMKEFEKEKLIQLKTEDQIAEPLKKRRKRKGGPNPLSCLKKRKVENEQPKKLGLKKRKRNRNKIRMLKKVKGEVLAPLDQ